MAILETMTTSSNIHLSKQQIMQASMIIMTIKRNLGAKFNSIKLRPKVTPTCWSLYEFHRVQRLLYHFTAIAKRSCYIYTKRQTCEHNTYLPNTYILRRGTVASLFMSCLRSKLN